MFGDVWCGFVQELGSKFCSKDRRNVFHEPICSTHGEETPSIFRPSHPLCQQRLHKEAGTFGPAWGWHPSDWDWKNMEQAATTWSWNSLLGLGTTRSMQIQIWSMFDETASNTTLSEFWSIVGWSLKWLQQGLWPTENHKGQKYAAASEAGKKGGTPLAEGWAAILWSLVGDLEYLTQCPKLPHYSSKSSPCALCRCKGDRSAHSWRDSRLDAAWLNMQWTPSAWRTWENRSRCDLFKFLPGLTACATSYDSMHSKYLGTDMVFMASCLWLLCHRILPGSPLENLKACWAKVQQLTQTKRFLTDTEDGTNSAFLKGRKGGQSSKAELLR